MGTVENIGRYRFDAASNAREGTFRVGYHGTSDECVRHDYPSCTVWHMGASRGDLCAHHAGRTFYRLILEALTRRVFIAERERRNRNGSRTIVENEGTFGWAERSADEHAAPVGQHGHSSDAVGAVMIAGNDNDGAAADAAEPFHEGIEQPDGTFRRGASVENVTCDDEDIRLTRADGVEHLIENGRVIAIERMPLKLPAEMPISSVQYPHRACPRRGSDTFYTAGGSRLRQHFSISPVF
jgi:hypothetical protein